VTIASGRPLTLRYRVILFDGTVPAPLVRDLAAEFRRTWPGDQGERCDRPGTHNRTTVDFRKCLAGVAAAVLRCRHI